MFHKLNFKFFIFILSVNVLGGLFFTVHEVSATTSGILTVNNPVNGGIYFGNNLNVAGNIDGVVPSQCSQPTINLSIKIIRLLDNAIMKDSNFSYLGGIPISFSENFNGLPATDYKVIVNAKLWRDAPIEDGGGGVGGGVGSLLSFGCTPQWLEADDTIIISLVSLSQPPSAPASVSASSICVGIHNSDNPISWSNVSNETGFKVYQNNTLIHDTIVADILNWPDTTPPNGNVSYEVRAYNNSGESAGTWSNAVTTVVCNDIPFLNPIGNQSVNEGDLLSFVVSGSDPDGDPLNFWVEYDSNGDGIYSDPTPPGVGFNPPTRTFSWTPNFSQAGTYPRFRFVVVDGSASDQEDITITVKNKNQTPFLNPIGNQSVNEGDLLSFVVSGSDPDGDPLNFWVEYDSNGDGIYSDPTPPGVGFNPPTRTFSWTPNFSQAGTYPRFRFVVVDGSASDQEDITITVNNVSPPTASINGDTVGTVGTALNFNASALGTNLNKIEIWRSPASSGPWTFVDSKNCNGNNTCNWSGSWTPTSAGDWYTVVNAHDNLGNKCTGNSIISFGWTDCGANDAVKTIVNVAPLPNQLPVAEASIVVDGVRYSFNNPLVVNKGESITITSFDADTDVNGDGFASYDPDGWTDPVNGVSTGGGKCEWNYNLDLVGNYNAPPITNPATTGACSIGPKIVKFDIAGNHIIKVLKITDKKGAASNESEIKITVNNVSPPTASINGDTVGTVGTALNFNASALGTNLNKIEIWRSPASSGPWTFVDSKNCNGNNTCNWSGSWTPTSAGDWYTVVNAHDNLGNKCTGNSIISFGWTDCGANDSVKTVVSVVAVPPPIIFFKADPSQIAPGNPTTLEWSVQNVDNDDCVGLSNPVYAKWDGNPVNSTKTAIGNEINVRPLSTTAFTLTCANGGGIVSKTVNVTVGNIPGPIETLRKIKNLLAGINFLRN